MMDTVQEIPRRFTPAARVQAFVASRLGERSRTALIASIWSGAGFAAMQGLRALATLLVARRIDPADLGIAGLVATLMVGLQMLSDLGIGQNVVQSRRGDEPDFLDTAFTLSLVRGIGLSLVAAALAYPFALIYRENYPDQSLVPLVVVAASSVALRGVASPAVWTLSRHIKTRAVALLTVGSELVGFAVAVAWVRSSPTAWALVMGTVGSAGAYAVMSYAIDRRIPRLVWDKAAASELIRFGSWMFLSTATYFMSGQAERLVLGKFISAPDMGCFSIAIMIVTVPSRGLAQLFDQVFFPMVSRLRRENPERAAVQFRRVKWLALGFAAAAGVVLVALGPTIVRILLPPKYDQAGWMLQLLGARAAMEIVTSPSGHMLLAWGYSKYAAIGNVVRIALLIPGLWFTLSRGDIVGAIWVLVLSPFGVYSVMLVGLRRCAAGILRTEFATIVVLSALLAAAWWGRAAVVGS